MTARRISALMLAGLISSAAFAAHAAEREYSQPAANDVPRQVFWGDTHVHTRVSADSYTLGNTTHSPEDAYRFAKGETVVANNGMKVKLRRPLDFLVVSDHAEYLGVFARVEDRDKQVLATDVGARWRGYMDAGQIDKMFGEFIGALTGERSIAIPAGIEASIWRAVGARADAANDPGHFTAFVGYEYTSMPNRSNLHRVVIYRDGADLTSQNVPFSMLDSEDPEGLWSALAAYEAETGGSVLAIPHNGNTSSGLMFDTKRFNGEPLTRDYAETRARWEPVVEVTQIKGDGETHPILSPEDEFADYETWNSWDGPSYEGIKTEGWEARKAAEYARSALKHGLKFENELGANPFKFGLIGSTDSHTALSTAEEDNFFGKFPTVHPSPARATQNWMPSEGGLVGQQESWTNTASGLGAIWARENTRAALFDALRRREVYATTGSRIVVRFFGGWDYADDAHTRPDYVDIGYEGGVPMGGDLTSASKGQAPRFIVVAAKDPDEANLDRVQIVKGWLDKKGAMHEKVYDVALSDRRAVDPETGKAPPVGSTVDVENATYTNTIGAPVLSTVWEDPDFKRKQRAFYYVRVIEIPKPRWTAYDAAFFGVDLPDEIPMTTQDRAYTSPIWYTP